MIGCPGPKPSDYSGQGKGDVRTQYALHSAHDLLCGEWRETPCYSRIWAQTRFMDSATTSTASVAQAGMAQ